MANIIASEDNGAGRVNDASRNRWRVLVRLEVSKISTAKPRTNVAMTAYLQRGDSCSTSLMLSTTLRECLRHLHCIVLSGARYRSTTTVQVWAGEPCTRFRTADRHWLR